MFYVKIYCDVVKGFNVQFWFNTDQRCDKWFTFVEFGSYLMNQDIYKWCYNNNAQWK